MYLIWDDREECGQWENATEDDNVTELLDKLFVEEEDVWIVWHHFQVAIYLVAQGIFYDFIASLRVLSLWNQIAEAILMVCIGSICSFAIIAFYIFFLLKTTIRWIWLDFIESFSQFKVISFWVIIYSDDVIILFIVLLEVLFAKNNGLVVLE